ncbi:MAG: glycosyltransferase [Acidobacteriota bacterium]
MNPRFSIIIPAYNEAQLSPGLLDSIESVFIKQDDIPGLTDYWYRPQR